VQAILTGRLVQTGDGTADQCEPGESSGPEANWGEQYNRKLSNLVSVQQELASDIYGRLRPKLARDEKKLLTKPATDDVESESTLLAGSLLFEQVTEGDFKRAR
jgi:hypothetical protein